VSTAHATADAEPRRRDGAHLTAAQVADVLHVSPKTVSRWAKEGKLPYMRTLGGHRRYPEREIRAIADGLRENIEQPA
jgi:excisionase family DNA binding protein